MQVSISFKNLEHTPALDERIREKSKHFEKFSDESTKLRWTCEVNNLVHHTELNVVCNGQNFHATGSSENLYKSFDIVIEKMEKQLLKQKEMAKNKLHRGSGSPVCLDPEMAWGEEEDDLVVPTPHKK